MAMNTESVHQSNGSKVEGDLGDLDIIEENSEDEVEVLKGAVILGGCNEVPKGLVRTSDRPNFSNILVKDSENVQFGNNTYFNGPVTIKQVIQTTDGVINASYVNREEEKKETTSQCPVPKDNDRKLTVKLWHKVSLAAGGVIVLAGICVIFIVQQDTSSNTSPSKTPDETETPTCHVLVVESSYGNWPLILVSIIFVPITLFLMQYYSVLINGTVPISNNGQVPNPHWASVADYGLKPSPEKRPVPSSGMHKRVDDGQIESGNKVGNLVMKDDHLRMVERNEWRAQPIVAPLDPLELPAPWVIITHTATPSCFTQSDCVYRVRNIQSYHVGSRGWFDIGYNFLIGGDGAVYEGRGWDFVGAHTKGYNKYSIAIALIGTFSVEPPTKRQFEACKKLIALGVEKGKIAKDYKLIPHSAFNYNFSPGKIVTDVISQWPHYVNEYQSSLRTIEQNTIFS